MYMSVFTKVHKEIKKAQSSWSMRQLGGQASLPLFTLCTDGCSQATFLIDPLTIATRPL